MVIKLSRDSARLDWMERHLQRPVPVTDENTGAVVNVNAWVLVGPVGLTLRETVDYLRVAQSAEQGNGS